MSAAERVERDGNVAVLVSPGFGAGWSTWAHDDKAREWALHSPAVVAWVDGGKVGDIDKIIKAALGDSYFYSGGARDLEVSWVPKGTTFRIEEYDGSESLCINDTYDWSVA